MLKSSFCHIPGIGPRYEARLWSQGIRTWEGFLAHHEPGIPPRRRASAAAHLERSLVELERGNTAFFVQSLPAEEHWRLFPEFRHSVAYLDIETAGRRDDNNITTAALYDGDCVKCYVHDQNLDQLARDIQQYKLIVSYNGKCFDVPFIEAALGVEVAAAHIDLRYVLRELGYQGGLKSCERQLGIDRGELDGLDGYFAVLLWHDYSYNANEGALETLLAYNVADVLNLEMLMVMSYNMKTRHTPFSVTHRFELPQIPSNPYRADRLTIARIRQALRRSLPGAE